VTGKTKDILPLLEKLNQKILKDLNVKLAENLSKSSGSVDPKAFLLFSQGVGYEDSGNLDQAAARYREALAIEPDFEQAKQRLQRLSRPGIPSR
jgi:predicted TPR repeat methyltransferase